MPDRFLNTPSSSPCLLGTADADVSPLAPADRSHALLHSLGRIFGVRIGNAVADSEARFLEQLATLFEPTQAEAETQLERHLSPWKRVYLIQHGVLRLFRETPGGKTAIHHFFAEGDLVWPVFGRARTVRSTLCLTSVTHSRLWQADFSQFRSTILAQGSDPRDGEGRWARFALALTEELAELTSMREFRKQTLPAKARYQLMLEEYPELVRRVPDNQLASWLGVAPATFSRLKHRRS